MVWHGCADTGLSKWLIGHTLRVFHRVLGQALKWNLLAHNLGDWALVRRIERAEMNVLTAEQVRAFLSATVDHPSRALYTLAVMSGMRAGNIVACNREVSISRSEN